MNFIPIANLRSRRHKNGKTITATFDQNLTATFDESRPSTEEVGNSSRAANDAIGGQAPSREQYADQTDLQDEDHAHSPDQHRPDDDQPDPDFEIPSLLRGFPEYSLETKLLDVDPNHYGILAGLSNSITFIPEKYVKKARKVFSMYMQRTIDDRTELSWKKFFLLATILFDNDSTRLLKDRKSLLMSRLVSLERDEWDSFTFGSLSKKKSRDASSATAFTTDEINKAAMRYVKVGEIGKAFSKLKQDRRKIVPSREVFRQLQQKHPSPGDSGLSDEEIQSIYDYDITRDEDVEAIRVDANIIESVLRKSRNLVAHGLDKTRYEHLKKLFGVNVPGAHNLPDVAEFRKLFTQVIQRIVNADLPTSVLPMFKDLESIALPKNDEDIRPVGLQVIYRKIAGTVCQSKTYQFNKEHFQNLQYCTTKSGTEIISHSFRLVLEEKPEFDVFAMDGDNAFNRMNRMRGLYEIRKHFPAMLPFLRMVYGSQSTSWYSGLLEGVEGIKSEEGVQQGCVNAMWLYAMTIHPFLQGIRDILGHEGFVKFFADDGNIAAPFEKMCECINFINQEGPKFGYFLKMSKGSYLLGRCDSLEIALERKERLVLLGLDPHVVKLHPDNDPGHVSEFGAKIVGSWIGSDQYIREQLAQKFETLKSEAEVIKQFPDSQSQNLMLRYCFCQKINYLQRLTPPPLMADFVAQFDDLKREIFQQILRKPDIPDPLWTQCCLDIQDGGLGYQLTAHVTPVAYIASVLEAKPSLDSLFPGFIDNRASKMVNALHDSLTEYGHLISDDQQILVPTLADLLEMLTNKPKDATFQSHLHEKTKAKTAKLFMDSIVDTRHLAWFDSLRKDSNVGGRWLEVSPKTDEYTFTPDAFRVALCYRLYLVIPPFIDGSRCSCKRRSHLDPLGHHLATGCGVGGTRHHTHDAIAHVLKDMLNYGGIMTRHEEIGCFREAFPDNNQRPDLSVFNMPNLDKKLVLDVAVASPVDAQGPRQISRRVALSKERRAKSRFSNKVAKYQAVSAANNLEFLPIIIESTGGLHHKALDFYNSVIDHMSSGDNQYKLMCNLFWSGRISCRLQKSIASAILSKSQVVNGLLTSERSFQFTPEYISNFPVATGATSRSSSA
jgi:hypothetical protein